MKNKVIILDVDGTLLPSNNELDLQTTSYLQELQNDNLIVLCSARGYHDLSILHDKMGLTGPIISSNGASLDFFDGKPNVTMSIDVKIVKSLFSNHKEIINSAFYSYKNDLFIYNKLDQLSFLYKITESSVIHEGPFDEIEITNPNSIYLILNNNRKEEIYDEVNQKYSDIIQITEYGHDAKISISILTLKNTNKAYAILELLMLLNKKEDETIIIGDNDADIGMLSLNGITAAMKNATMEAKAVAKYVTEFDNNNQGVMKFLKSLDK